MGNHTACALLDCRQFYLINSSGFGPLFLYDSILEMFLDKMYGLKDDNLNGLMREFMKLYTAAPELLKCLIQKKAEDSHIELVWDSIQSRDKRFYDYYCYVPLAALKRLVYEQDISIDNVQKMLSTLNGFQEGEKRSPQEVHVLYTVIFWEASEKVISHFLKQVPNGFKLNYHRVLKLLLVTKYSRGLCIRLLQRCGRMNPYWQDKLQDFRPDLAWELGLLNTY